MAKTTKNGIEERLSWLGPLALGVLILVIYGTFVRAPFAYDDRIHILENPQVLAFGSSGAAGAIRGLVENPFGLAGRPLLFLTYGLNYATSGADPAVFRLTNFVIHAANSILVFFIALELALLRKQDSVRFALLAAGLFAAHPLLTESVTYIAGRSSSLCATFYFAGLYFALRAGRSESRVRTMLLPLVLVCAALGWLVKQDAIVLPPLPWP